MPVLPGEALGLPRSSGRRPRKVRLPFVVGAAVAVVAGIAIGTVLLTRGPSRVQAPAFSVVVTPTVATPTVATTTAPATTVATAPRVTAAAQARAAAERLAAELPVELDSTALLQVGGAVYAVGGLTRGGKPTAAIWRLDLAGGPARRVGMFIEPLTDAAVARRGGVLYLAGGWTGEKLATAVLSWSPGRAPALVARLPVALRGAAAGFAGSLLYVAKGSNVFAVDVGAGTVARAAKLPLKLRGKDSNLDYLIQSQASYH